MSTLTSYMEDDIHFLEFPSHITTDQYDDIFTQAYTLVGDLSWIKLIMDLSKMDYINSGFIGMVAEFFSSVEEQKWHMVILTNHVLEDTFKFVGFNDFVDIVLSRDEALSLLKIPS